MIKKFLSFLFIFLSAAVLAGPTVRELEKRVRLLEEKAETLRGKDPDFADWIKEQASIHHSYRKAYQYDLVHAPDEAPMILDEWQTLLERMEQEWEIFHDMPDLEARGLVNVREFGAKADGENDDVPAIQKAIDFAVKNAKGGIFLPRGRYLLNRRKGIISAYDQHFVRHSAPIGWDWRLMAAQCYQESGFDPHAISWAGARGLMQIMPETADLLGIPVGHLNDPGTNIKAAAQYIRKLQETFSDIPGRVDRIRFILAAYNGGAGHVRDAMTLARQHGKDSRRWEDVAPFILKLSEPRYYNRPDMKFGYLRGSETYNYVNDIMRRWEQYRNAAGAKVSSATGDIRPAMPRGFKSKVLSPEEMEAKYRDEKEETAETGETAPADNQKETEE